MRESRTENLFTGSIPELYETHLVPLLFEPYVADLTNRVAPRAIESVLEIAAGTGVVTRNLASVLPKAVSIVATDLSQAMLDKAEAVGTQRLVDWCQADAMQLPFPDNAFDAVVCQFGVMFFPDKAKAFSEARRVLKPGGAFIFNVWDRIEENEFANTVVTAIGPMFPSNPPQFVVRTPHGYFDLRTIQQDLANGGFTVPPQISTVTKCSRAKSARIPAIAFCQGTPMRNEIEARDASRLGDATNIAAEAIARKFGQGPVEGKMQAHVVVIEN